MQGQEIKSNWKDDTYSGAYKHLLRASSLELWGGNRKWKLNLYVHRLRGRPEEMKQHGWYLSSHQMSMVDEKLEAQKIEEARAEAIKLALEWLAVVSSDMDGVERELRQGQGGWYIIKGQVNSCGFFECYPGELPQEINAGDVLTFRAEMIDRDTMVLKDAFGKMEVRDGEEKAEKEK